MGIFVTFWLIFELVLPTWADDFCAYKRKYAFYCNFQKPRSPRSDDRKQKIGYPEKAEIHEIRIMWTRENVETRLHDYNALL